MSFARLGVVCCLLSGAAALGQTVGEATYSRVNTWSAFGEYSNDSSRILMGNAVNRKIGAVGFGYERRLLHRRSFNFSYAAEWRPGMMESDPAQIVTTTETTPYSFTQTGPAVAVLKCAVAVLPFNFTFPGEPPISGVETDTCGRAQVVQQSLTPLGFRVNGWTRRRIQPTFRGDLGMLFSSQQEPVPGAGNFNVMFDFGPGVEFYSSHAASVRLEYVVQHYGNLGTAGLNPGVDNGFAKLTWTWGR
jgi:hypothetical protein